MPKIKRATIETVCQAAASTFPREFIALLSESKGLIDSVVVLPATFGERFSSIRVDLLPPGQGVVGSVHSHPGPNAQPSKADLRVFKRTGRIHLIIAHPFTFESIKAFDAEGQELKIEVVE